MIVVFDTNIWLQSLYLQSPAGAAARFYISYKKARVALPEVIRLEVEHHLRNDISSYIAKIKDNHERLLAMFGTLKEIVLPNKTDIEQKIAEGFGSLGVDLVEVPFSFESARSSFLRTINKKPPSDRSQQFKDGVLWADCLSLLKEDEVVLVTDDRAFYEGYECSNGLAAALRGECASLGKRLTLVARLPDLLKEIRSNITIDHVALANAFLEKVDQSIERLLQVTGFQLAERTQLDAELFVTENPQILFLEFKITFRCIDVSGVDRGDGSLEVRGDGLYNSSTGEFSNLSELGSELKFRDAQGIEQENRNIILRVGGIALGHKNVSHAVRFKLD